MAGQTRGVESGPKTMWQHARIEQRSRHGSQSRVYVTCQDEVVHEWADMVAASSAAQWRVSYAVYHWESADSDPLSEERDFTLTETIVIDPHGRVE